MDLVFPLPETNIKELHQYMLLKSNIEDFNNQTNQTNQINQTNQNNKITNDNYQKMIKNKDNKNIYKKLQTTSNNYFWPREKDQLFWCFYVSLYDKDTYFDNKRKSFTIEHDFKIQSVEKLRKIKDTLKIHKIRRNLVEDELVNCKKITTSGLHALCLLYKKNIIIVRKRTFIKFCYDIDNSEYKLENYNVIIVEDDKYYIDYELNDEKFKTIITSYFHLENLEKPLKSPSGYSLGELQNISIKLDIDLQGENGKNKTKNILYEKILEKLA